MAWDGVDRRLDVVSFNGLERRAAARARVLANATRLPMEEVRELAHQRHREEAETWEATEYLE
jgi:hypothetical protein